MAENFLRLGPRCRRPRLFFIHRVPRPYPNWCAFAQRFTRLSRLLLRGLGEHVDRDDASLGSMPLFHVYGLYSELLHAYRMRCQYHFSGTNPYDILQALQKGQGKVTLLFTVPWMVRQLLDIPGGPDALSRLRYVNLGGAALDETLGQRLDAGGIRIVQGYGMTELGAVLMQLRPKGATGGTCIRLFLQIFGTSIRLTASL